MRRVHDERRPRAGSGATSSNSSTADDTPAALFGATVSVGAYGNRTTSYSLPDDPSPHGRGLGPRRPPTTGPTDAAAPQWWWAEAERIILALIAAGHTVTSDDLHERYPHEPSASGAAFGGLFSRLASAGRIVEVGWARSRRPAARGRRIIEWGRP
jgi:hypothetical protein